MIIPGISTIGLIGAGHIGSQLARLSVASGYNVVISNSRGPETLADLVEELGPKARAATAEEAAEAGELVNVTIPLKAYASVPVAPLEGKIVIDTNNYYPQRDGNIAELDDHSTTSAALLQKHLPTSRVAKAFNHIESAKLTSEAQAAATENRRALVIYGDNGDAKTIVATLINGFGFDVVDDGSLANSWRIEPGTPAYGPRGTVSEITAMLAAASR
jgi:predicted dinucleotide-binding enzyme